MKTLRRKLSALLAVVLILGVIAVPSVFASTKVVTGGTTKAKAIKLNVDGYEDAEHYYYSYSLKSTQTLTYFKFKTKSYRAYYNIYVEQEDLSYSNFNGPEFIFRRADDTVIARSWAYNGTNIFRYNLKPNSWYYFIIKNTSEAKASGLIDLYVRAYKDEDRNTKASAQKIELGKTYDCNLHALNDEDYYKFTPTATGKYTVIVRAVENTFKTYTNDWPAKEVTVKANANFIRADGSIAQKRYMTKKGEALIRNCTLTKGKTYYIKVGYLNGKSLHNGGSYSEPWSYKVRIQKKK